NRSFTLPRTLAASAAAAAALMAAHPARALEVAPGDYEFLPPGINIGLLYVQHAKRSELYSNGSKVLDDAKLTSDIGMARYIRPVELNASTTLALNAILPFGRLKTDDQAAILGSANGTADLVLGAPVEFLLDSTTRDAFSIGPFVY